MSVHAMVNVENGENRCYGLTQF